MAAGVLNEFEGEVDDPHVLIRESGAPAELLGHQVHVVLEATLLYMVEPARTLHAE
jgi:hypothetical protein